MPSGLHSRCRSSSAATTIAGRAAFELLGADGFAELEPNYLYQGTLAIAAEVAGRLRDQDGADELLSRLETHQSTILTLGAVALTMGAADRWRGMLCGVLGRWDEIDRHYGAALDLEARLVSPPLQARTLAWWAHDVAARAGSGDADRSRQLAARSRAIATPIGQHGVLRLLEDWSL